MRPGPFNLKRLVFFPTDANSSCLVMNGHSFQFLIFATVADFFTVKEPDALNWAPDAAFLEAVRL